MPLRESIVGWIQQIGSQWQARRRAIVGAAPPVVDLVASQAEAQSIIQQGAGHRLAWRDISRPGTPITWEGYFLEFYNVTPDPVYTGALFTCAPAVAEDGGYILAGSDDDTCVYAEAIHVISATTDLTEHTYYLSEGTAASVDGEFGFYAQNNRVIFDSYNTTTKRPALKLITLPVPAWFTVATDSSYDDALIDSDNGIWVHYFGTVSFERFHQTDGNLNVTVAGYDEFTLARAASGVYVNCRNRTSGNVAIYHIATNGTKTLVWSYTVGVNPVAWASFYGLHNFFYDAATTTFYVVCKLAGASQYTLWSMSNVGIGPSQITIPAFVGGTISQVLYCRPYNGGVWVSCKGSDNYVGKLVGGAWAFAPVQGDAGIDYFYRVAFANGKAYVAQAAQPNGSVKVLNETTGAEVTTISSDNWWPAGA